MKRSRADDQSTHRGRRQSKDRQIGESDKEDQMKQQFKNAVNSLGPYDVICGRGSLAFNNVGNRRFRELIGMNVDAYNNSQGRRHKGLFIGSLVQRLQHQIGARFYKLKDGRLVELKVWKSGNPKSVKDCCNQAEKYTTTTNDMSNLLFRS